MKNKRRWLNYVRCGIRYIQFEKGMSYKEAYDFLTKRLKLERKIEKLKGELIRFDSK